MGAFRVLTAWILHYAGLYFQVNASLVEQRQVDNHIFGHALFTEVPTDLSAQAGEDVEMSCSFRGAGSLSYSLEIQWWYLKDQRGQSQSPSHISNQVVSLEETSEEATKISVVKVAGSNISHKLRLSGVRASDEGVYECRVIDFSGTEEQQYRVQAFLHVNDSTDDHQTPEYAGLQELQAQNLNAAPGGVQVVPAPTSDCPGSSCGL